MKWYAVLLATVLGVVVVGTVSAAPSDQGRRLAGPFCVGKRSLKPLEGDRRGIALKGFTARRAILRAGAVRSIAVGQKCFPWEIRRLGLQVRGPAGPAGPAGQAGARGPAGDKGATGAAGPQGPPGSGGSGSQGPKGDTGAAGPPGPKGDTGSSGAAGTPGAQGVPGPPGPGGGLGDHIAILCITMGNNVKYGGADGSLCDPGHDEQLHVVIVGAAPPSNPSP